MKLIERFNSRLTHKFMLGIIPVSISGIILLGAMSYYAVKNHLITIVEKEMQTLSAGAAASMAGICKYRANDIETLSETPILADYYNNLDYGLIQEAGQYRQELEKYFLKFFKRTGSYISIMYVDERGAVICAVKAAGIVKSAAPFENKKLLHEIARTKQGYFKSEIIFETEYGPSIFYGKPIFDISGKFKGAIITRYSMRMIQKVLSQCKVGNSGVVYITDLSNKPILSAEYGSTQNYINADMYESVPVEGTDFKVALIAKMSDFQSPLVKIRDFTIISVAVCSFLVTLFIYFLIRTLTRPIQILAEATKRLAQGNMKEQVNIKRDDEIGHLARSFNIMAENLMQRTAELEDRIRELIFLHKMSGTVIQRLEADNIYKVCLEAAVSGLGFERGVLYTINHELGIITGRYVHSTHDIGFTDERLQKRKIPLDSGDILAHVAAEKKPVNIQDPFNDPRCNPKYLSEIETKAFCLVPIMTNQKVFGIIGVDNYYSERPITDDQMNNLMLFCNFTGLALDNAELLSGLKWSEAKYRAVLDNSVDAIVGLDKSLKITIWNNGAAKMFGYPAEKMTGQPISGLFEKSVFEAIIREIVRQGFFAGNDIPAVSAEGRKLNLDITWAGSEKDKHPGKEYTVVMRDISEHKKLQAQLIQAEKLSAVGQLISGIAHELNNPLSVILGYSELLEKMLNGKKNAAFSDEINHIYESSKRCREIISNLLAFVRESRDKKQIIDVTQAIKNTISLMEYKLCKTENINITQKLEDYLPPVAGDIQQLEQVMVNLIQNACDALSQKEKNKEIEIRTYHRHNYAYIAVTDNGPGIPAHLRQNVFEPFFTTKEEGHGTGLGLAICRRIMDKHGGKISFTSAPDAGTTFTIELPIVQTGFEPAPAGIDAPKAAKLPAGRKALIIDDEKDVVSLIKKILEKEGLTAHTALSVHEAGKKLKETAYDLVICDIEMGPEKGFEVQDMLSAGKCITPLIFTTGNMLSPKLLERIQASGVPCLAKPFNISELISAAGLALQDKEKDTAKN